MRNGIRDLKERSKYREKLLESIIKRSDPIKSFPNTENFLVLARQWNSWYPSSYKVEGGCYFFNINKEIIIIDPGFNTLEEIIRHKLDIRLIRHVFVTHFHPDHYENLIKLLTRLTSHINKITIYLNSTTFQHFIIYKKDNTEFIELKPGVIIDLEIPREDKEFNIKLIVGKSFHREIGGAMNSIGLKFVLDPKEGGERFFIGFMSDTDGLEEYIDYYQSFYNDCQILVPHLGSIHKFPNGYKHLYLSGLMALLKKLRKDNKMIFLGEFGFELGSDRAFYMGLSEIFPEHISYEILCKTIYEFSRGQSEDSLLIGKFLAQRFEACIKKIRTRKIITEIIFPLIILDHELSKKGYLYREYEDKIIKKLKLKLEQFKSHYSENDFKILWWEFLKAVIFEASDLSIYKDKMIEKMSIWGFEDLRQEFDKTITNFIPYLTEEFKDYLINELTDGMALIFGNRTSNLDYILPRGHFTEVYEYPDILIEQIKNFTGFTNELRKILSKKWGLLFSFLFFAYFLIRLKEISESRKDLLDEDGRKKICEYLINETEHRILPVHPSYKIHFFKSKGMYIEGHCKNKKHLSRVELSNFNRNWNFFLMGTIEEYIDVIPMDNCETCGFWMDMEISQEPPQYIVEEHIKQYYVELNRRINEFRCSVDDATELYDIFLIFNVVDNDVFRCVKSDMFLEKLKNLIEEERDPDLMLLHPKLLLFDKIGEIVKERLEPKTNEEKRILFQRLLFNEMVMKDEYHYKILDNDQLIDIFRTALEEADITFKIKCLVEIARIFSLKVDNGEKLIENSLFTTFKKMFIIIFFPLIENPNAHIEKYETFTKYRSFLSNLHKLGYPFKIYVKQINRNIYDIIKRKK